MSETLLNIGLVLVFILVGGLFAAAEMALVSIREGQVNALATTGRRGAAVARLASEPNRFLSAVQVGVTLAGFMSAAFGGATLADDLAPALRHAGLSASVANVVALVLITVVISYFSIVLSELVAKRIALQRTVPVALAVAPTVDRLARISKPVIWLLSVSTDVVVRLLGGDPAAGREQMTDEELRRLVKTHGGLSEEERQIVDDVFDAGDHQLREVMLPRTEVDFMDASMPVYKAVKYAGERPHSRYPVIRDSVDDVVGFVHVRDLFDPDMQGRSVHVGELVRDVVMLPTTRNVLSALTDMRRVGVHLA
ncbi:MAG: hemolysin family protein, partial [Nocardioidaceae bacterium]